MKKILIIMITMILSLNATTYNVKYHGMTLGEITDLSTIKDLYLKAKVTSRVARFMLGEDNLVYYGGDKPDVDNSKYKKDKKMILYAFRESITQKPKFKKFKINDIKNITLSCESNQSCKFVYYKKGKVNGEGDIKFDENGKFVSITEKKSNFEISKK
jgi:hypothetical protein